MTWRWLSKLGSKLVMVTNLYHVKTAEYQGLFNLKHNIHATPLSLFHTHTLSLFLSHCLSRSLSFSLYHTLFLSLFTLTIEKNNRGIEHRYLNRTNTHKTAILDMHASFVITIIAYYDTFSFDITSPKSKLAYDGHFCQVPRVVVLNKFDCISSLF